MRIRGITLSSVLFCSLACDAGSDGDSGWRADSGEAVPSTETVSVTFGPSASVRVLNITPNCEELTTTGEFTAHWYAQAGNQAPVWIGGLDHHAISDGETVSVDLSASIKAGLGEALCVFSSGTEEDDTYLDDAFTSEGEACVTVERQGDTTFAFQASRETCTMLVEIPASIAP